MKDEPAPAMATAHIFVATSLDGYIARADGNIDWLMKHDDSGEDYGWKGFIDDIDAIVMGRASFEMVRGLDPWPFARPVIVASRTLDESAIPLRLADRAQISPASPHTLLELLADRGWSRVQVDGGRLVQSFLRAGLVSDITITRVPVLLGSGRLLFGSLIDDIELRHMETRSWPSGLVRSRYEFS